MTNYLCRYIIIKKLPLRVIPGRGESMLNIKVALENKNISTKALAAFLGVSEKTAYNKLMGITEFTYSEAERITEHLLPEYNTRYLFSKRSEPA